MWGVPRARVESQSPHDAATCFAVESKKIFRERSDGISRLRGHTTRARKIPPKIGPLEKKASPLAGKDSIRRRRLGDGLSGDCLPLKQEQSRPLTWQTNRRQVFCLSERQNCETDERSSGCRFESAKNNLGLCARARSALDTTPLGTRGRRRLTSRTDNARTCAPRRGEGWQRLALDPRRASRYTILGRADAAGIFEP